MTNTTALAALAAVDWSTALATVAAWVAASRPPLADVDDVLRNVTDRAYELGRDDIAEDLEAVLMEWDANESLFPRYDQLAAALRTMAARA